MPGGTSKKANKAGRSKDKYYFLAKEQGYRARSAFKLVELNRTFDLLRGARTAILDLCAAPGGWLQVCRKYAPAETKVIGVDLMPIRAIHGVETLVEDITTTSCRAALRRALQAQLGGKEEARGVVDLVLHDGAPNVGQNWIKDAFGQSELVLSSLKLATEFLRPRGSFVTKVFRSADYNSLLWVFHQLFDKVDATKPQSSRNASAEIFVVCRGFKAPARIDPRLLDARFVFKEIDASGAGTGLAGGGGAGTVDVMHKKARDHKRQREGYDSTLGPLLTRRLPVMDFLRAADAVRMLTDASAFDFDAESKALGVDALEYTTDEVRACCDDLKVLGRSDFKVLLKWRFFVRRAMPELAREEKGGKGGRGEGGDGEGGDGEDSDESEGEGGDSEESDAAGAEISRELSATAAAELARRKRERKRAAKARQVAIRRQRLGMNMRSVDLLDTDDSLFSLAKLRRYARGNDAAIASLLEDGDVEIDDEDGNDAGYQRSATDGGDVGGASGGEDGEDEDGEGDENLDSLLGEGGEGGLLEKLRTKEKRDKLDSLEDELDTAFSRFVASQEKRAEQFRSTAESGRESHGIKLSRRAKLERQAMLTEAALNDKLDTEHKRYLGLLAGARGDTAVDVMAAALPEPPHAGTKRKRALLAAVRAEAEGGDEEAGDDDDDDDDDEEGVADVDEMGVVDASAVALPSRGSRWFSQGIFADANAAEEAAAASMRKGAGSGDLLSLGAGRAKASSRAGDEDGDGDGDAGAGAVARSGASSARGARGREKPQAKPQYRGPGVAVPVAEEDSDGDVFPDWLKDLPRTEREARKAKLKKRREKLERRAGKELKRENQASGFEVVAGSSAIAEDIDDQFRGFVEAETRKLAGAAAGDSDDDGALAAMEEDGEPRVARPASAQRLLRAGMGKAAKGGDGAASGASGGFETVAATAGGKRPYGTTSGVVGGAVGDDSDSDSDETEDESDASSADPRNEDYDSDTHAEMLALGKKLKRHTTAKALVDASYNRYAFSDDNLPAWFATDESRHFRPQLPITRAEVEAIKARFRDIASRPIHKVAEARARKKRRIVNNLEKAKRKAATLLSEDNEDMSGRSKMKAIAKAYRSAEVKRPGSVYVVAGKGSTGSKGKGKRVKFVDRLLKKETRAKKRHAKHAKTNRAKK